MCQHFSFVCLIHSEALSRFCFSILVESSSLHLQRVAAFVGPVCGREACGRCCCSVGPASKTMRQHCTDIGWTFSCFTGEAMLGHRRRRWSGFWADFGSGFLFADACIARGMRAADRCCFVVGPAS